MAPKIGFNYKLYRNTGTYGSPTWNEITVTRDLTLNMTHGEAVASSRASEYEVTLATLKQVSIDFSTVLDTAGDDYAALKTAFLNRTTVDCAVADGAIATAGTEYFRCDYVITNFTRSEPLQDVVTVDVTLKPTPSSNTPGYTTVS